MTTKGLLGIKVNGVKYKLFCVQIKCNMVYCHNECEFGTNYI
jgi:hypothetical protein